MESWAREGAGSSQGLGDGRGEADLRSRTEDAAWYGLQLCAWCFSMCLPACSLQDSFLDTVAFVALIS